MPPKRTKKTAEPAKTENLRFNRDEAVKVADMPKKTAASRKRKSAKAELDPNNYVVIDHPQQDEVISGLHYAIRIGSSSNGAAEISFNGGEWQPCRPAAGYWWFDWGYFTPGTYKIVARLRDDQGNTLTKSDSVKVEVQ